MLTREELRNRRLLIADAHRRLLASIPHDPERGYIEDAGNSQYEVEEPAPRIDWEPDRDFD